MFQIISVRCIRGMLSNIEMPLISGKKSLSDSDSDLNKQNMKVKDELGIHSPVEDLVFSVGRGFLFGAVIGYAYLPYRIVYIWSCIPTIHGNDRGVEYLWKILATAATPDGKQV
jgi:hypothetical protein